MTMLTIDLPPDVYQRLRVTAASSGKSVEELAGEWLIERLPPKNDRERVIEVLRSAGMLAEPTQWMREVAAQSTATLEEVQATFARIGGKPLSEIVIEMRGPKE